MILLSNLRPILSRLLTAVHYKSDLSNNSYRSLCPLRNRNSNGANKRDMFGQNKKNSAIKTINNRSNPCQIPLNVWLWAWGLSSVLKELCSLIVKFQQGKKMQCWCKQISLCSVKTLCVWLHLQFLLSFCYQHHCQRCKGILLYCCPSCPTIRKALFRQLG